MILSVYITLIILHQSQKQMPNSETIGERLQHLAKIRMETILAIWSAQRDGDIGFGDGPDLERKFHIEDILPRSSSDEET